MGERVSRWAAIAMMIALYLLCVALVATGYVTPVLLVVVLALPKLRQALPVFAAPRPEQPPAEYPEGAWPLWFVSFAFVHNRAFGAWFFLGLVADLVLQRTVLAG